HPARRGGADRAGARLLRPGARGAELLSPRLFLDPAEPDSRGNRPDRPGPGTVATGRIAGVWLALRAPPRAIVESPPGAAPPGRGRKDRQRNRAMRMTTEEAFVKVLQMHGISDAFGIIGSAF